MEILVCLNAKRLFRAAQSVINDVIKIIIFIVIIILFIITCQYISNFVNNCLSVVTNSRCNKGEKAIVAKCIY